MTREEKMWEAVEKEHGKLSRREAFVALTTMEWADETMIEKVWQWLKAHIKLETLTFSDVWDTSIVDILATDFTTVDEMEESFRKIMEE